MSRYGGESYSGVYDDYRVRRRSSSRPREESNVYYGHRRSGSGSSISSVSDYDYRTNYSGTERQVRVPRDVIRAPTPPPLVQRVVERAPTPEPDIVERVIVRPQPQQLIERIIERPRTPPPKIVEKEISEPAPPPIVRTRVVKVDPSPRHFVQAQPHRSHDIYHRQAATPNYTYTTEYIDTTSSNTPNTVASAPQATPTATPYTHDPRYYTTNYTVENVYPQAAPQQQVTYQTYPQYQVPTNVAPNAYPMQYQYAYRQPNVAYNGIYQYQS